MKTNHPHRSQSMRRTLFAAALAVIVIAAIMIVRRHAAPSPLTPQETRELIADMSKFSPGLRVANLRRDSDGKVRAEVIDERFSKNGPEKQTQQATSAEDRLAHLEVELKTLQKEVASLREQRLNDQLLLQLSGTWHELNPKADTKENVPAVKPNVWRLTAFGNCDRHEIGEEVKVVVLGELSVDASKPQARITFKRHGPDGKSNLAVGIVRFRTGLCEIAMARKLVPAGGDPAPVFPTEFQTTQDADLVLLARADLVP